MHGPTNLQRRLALIGIDEDTKHNIRIFRPVFTENIDDIIGRFYSHILSFPEGKEILANQDIKSYLRPRQKAHWAKLFSGKFDEHYAASALRVGQVHYKSKVPPYLYIASYNFFHCELIKVASQHYGHSTNLAGVLASITRLISLDMDLALSAYTRELWIHAVSDVVDDRNIQNERETPKAAAT